ncbi:HIT family protein [Dichotomicrobium thermohalophilum]|uniref:Histidine triad (HIT) family protein n=1 Tax=Dichotomicrobium thermohalophilum TaxID=933063 RepID=A0A397PH02_9HYPH|nr:HIT family protein [Dichotomicrobium thermohalophilum]RIA47773.1 histidine triad (HIT) family protein [Dichotomicrobium thermohalophilum]
MSEQPPAYDPDNIFAKILRGEMPCFKVYEDDHTLAFMDIMPRTDGHTLIIPKAPSRTLLDARPEDVQHAAVTSQKIAQAAQKAFNADGILFQQSSESAAGQVIFHLHFHIMPRWDGVDLRPPGQKADDDVLEEHAQRIRDALASL